MTHFRASVFTSYSSPTFTFFAALTEVPFCFTLPVSQAAAAMVLVLKRRMDHRYLSSLSFSFSAISSISMQRRVVQNFNGHLQLPFKKRPLFAGSFSLFFLYQIK